MVDPQLLAAWRTRLAGYSPGELTVRQWCRREGITLDQYYRWRKRTAEPCPAVAPAARPAQRRSQPWVAVEVVEPAQRPAATTGVTVRIGAAAIELQPGFDASTFRTVVAILEAPGC